MSRRIYLVTQDVHHLYGCYLTRAIVVAADADAAREAAIQACATRDGEGDWDPIQVHRARLTVVSLGNLDETVELPCGYGDYPGTLVLSRDHGQDDDDLQNVGDEREYYPDWDGDQDEEDEEYDELVGNDLVEDNDA